MFSCITLTGCFNPSLTIKATPTPTCDEECIISEVIKKAPGDFPVEVPTQDMNLVLISHIVVVVQCGHQHS